MKVVCITEDPFFNLTYGKTYGVVESFFAVDLSSITQYKIINDNDCERWYDEALFISIEEWREKQLNELLP